MQSNNKQINIFLLVVEGLGLVFVSIFSAAYLLGLPSTAVLHSEPAFRTVLSVLGILFIVLVLSAFIVSILVKKKA
jgi:hypothetical protein